MTNLHNILKGRDIPLPTNVWLIKSMVFPVVIHECESWTIKKAERQRIDALELGITEDSWGSLGLQGVQNSKRNQFWIFIGRTDAEGEALIIWPPDAKNWVIRKDPDEEDWGREQKGLAEGEMVGCHCQLNGREFEQALGLGDGQGSLACCSPCDRRVGHNWPTEMI